MAEDFEHELTVAAATVSTQTGSGERKARAYWDLGRLLHSQLGLRAHYGEHSIDSVAKRLGLLPRTLYRARLFYQRLPNLTTWSGLSWSHCRALVTVGDDAELHKLLEQTRDHRWSVRQLQSQIRLLETGSSLKPRRGRLHTYCLRPEGKGTLDVGFGVRLDIEALGTLTERAKRLLESHQQNTTQQISGKQLIVEFASTPQGVDLRPVWGAARQRLYTYRLHDPQILPDGQLVGQLGLAPHIMLSIRIALRGVGDLGSDRHMHQLLATSMRGMQLAVAIDQPGPPAQVDLFALADPASEQQIVDDGTYVNQMMLQSNTKGVTH